MDIKVGVVAIQGDFSRHSHCIFRLGATPIPVREPEDLGDLDALIIPGGESTTLSVIGWKNGLWDEVKRIAEEGTPIMGTCAGVIMLAKTVENGESLVTPLSLLDIKVRRNAYGSQVDSFECSLKVSLDGNAEITGVFIRAPIISGIGDKTEVLAVLQGYPVFVKEGRIWGLTFHPELSGSLEIHREFLSLTEKNKNG